MSTQETPLSAFFSSFAFNRYRYDPSRDPADEFERLCVARKWGNAKKDKNFAKYLSAIKETLPPATPNTGCPAAPTQETPLSAFFSGYTFKRYAYDPSRDPADEFERLCVARQWGKSRRDENFARYLSAIGETRNRPLANFFRRYQFLRFVHDPLADPQAEFDRLQAARRWGEKKLERVREEFRVALGARSVEANARPATRTILERPPIAEFLKERQFDGYTYGDDRPELEFRRLVEAQRRNWEEKQMGKGRDIKSKEVRREWKALAERTALQEEFYEALEEQFNLRLDKIAGGTGLRRDEVMVELCGVGKAPLSKVEAAAALDSVHVNIYDFLQLELPTTITTTDYETRNLLQSLSPRARALNFPDDAMLAVYSVFTHRVFPRSQAREGRTLVLLLRVIGQYFGDFREALGKFKKEGGEELDVAVEKGPDAVRELLLSRKWETLEAIREASRSRLG